MGVARARAASRAARPLVVDTPHCVLACEGEKRVGGRRRRRYATPQKSTHHTLSTTLQVKKAIEKGNIEGAKIYAQNAIRKKGEALNYLRLASRLDAVVSRLDTQAKMQGVTKSMAGIVKSLDRALAANNLDKVRRDETGGGTEKRRRKNDDSDSPNPHTQPHAPQVAETMDQFEKQFENLDVQSQVLEGAMGAQAALATPEEDVTTLLQQVADEHGLEVQLGLPQAGAAPVAAPAKEAAPDDLAARLAQLRGGG